MSGGEAFVILAAADIAMSERRARHPRPASRDQRQGGRLANRSWTEILVTAAAGIVVVMVAMGSIAAERVASAAGSTAGTTVVEPDPLILCSTVNGQAACVREPT
jgi:hypothetical protein